MQLFVKQLNWLLKSRYSIIKKKISKAQHQLPFNGFENHQNTIKFVDLLSDKDLQELNNILDWNCFVVDSNGRRFGGKNGISPKLYPIKESH